MCTSDFVSQLYQIRTCIVHTKQESKAYKQQQETQNMKKGLIVAFPDTVFYNFKTK